MSTSKKLVFVYNANSDMGSKIFDAAHKILNPKTYQCNLCDMTYGAFTEKSVWKNFRKSTDLDMVFLHKDEFGEAYNSAIIERLSFPVVLEETERELMVLINTDELNDIKQSEQLIDLIKQRCL